MQNGPNIEDYLNQGIYGKKEINPGEKKKFLGTFRERVVIALTKNQVYKPSIYKEVEQEMKKNADAKLILNGSVNYEYLRKYVKIAYKYNIPFTIVENKEHDTDIGLVLAHDYAVDKENIFVSDESQSVTTNDNMGTTENGIKGFFKKLFS